MDLPNLPRLFTGLGARRCRCLLFQAAMCPPSFVFFVNDAKLLTDDYR